MKRNNFRYIFKMVIKMCTRTIKNEENVEKVKIGLMTYFPANMTGSVMTEK